MDYILRATAAGEKIRAFAIRSTGAIVYQAKVGSHTPYWLREQAEKDKKHGSFNPYLLPLQTDEPLADYIEHSLNNALSEALLSYGLLDKGRFDPLINNVLCVSCVNIQNNILERYRQEDSEKSNEESI